MELRENFTSGFIIKNHHFIHGFSKGIQAFSLSFCLPFRSLQTKLLVNNKLSPHRFGVIINNPELFHDGGPYHTETSPLICK